MYKRFILFLVAAAFLFSGCNENGNTVSEVYYVRKVVDGDTVELTNGMKVRYTGIDTPETRKRVGGEWLYDPEEYASAAKDYNEQLVSNGPITLEFDEVREDKYGRILAYVFTDNGLMANVELVKAGLATVYTFPPNDKYYDELILAQLDAKENERGLWNTMEIIFPMQANDHIGKHRKVIGAVSKSGIARTGIFIHLGPDEMTDLTLLVYRRNIPQFAEKGIDPASFYRGKNLEAVGKIEKHKGPVMVIDNPSQIKVVE